MRRFSELCDCINDQCTPESCGASVYVGLEHIDSGAFFLKRHGSPSEVQSAKSRFRKGDILYGKLRPYLDKAVVAQTDGICSTDILVFRAKPAVRAAYLLGLIHTQDFLDHAAQTTNGVNHPRTSWPGLSPFAWDVPDRTEQEKIAAALWKIQRAIDVEEKLMAAARELKQAAMRQLFTCGLRGESQQETEIGSIPESWNVVQLGSRAKIGSGTTPNRQNSEYWLGGTTPWITSGRMYERRITGAETCVTQTALEECSLPILRPGAILMAIVGQGKTLGHCAILDVEATVSRHVGFIQLQDENISPEFVRGYLDGQYEYLRQLAAGNGSTRAALTSAILRGLSVPVPSPDEQREIVAIRDTMDCKISVHERKSAALRELFKTMLHQLMTGEIRVADLEIDTREVTA